MQRRDESLKSERRETRPDFAPSPKLAIIGSSRSLDFNEEIIIMYRNFCFKVESDH